MVDMQHVRRQTNREVSRRDKPAKFGENFRDEYYKSKLNKTFSFTGFPWHLDEKDEWLNMKSNTWHRRAVGPTHRSSIQPELEISENIENLLQFRHFTKISVLTKISIFVYQNFGF